MDGATRHSRQERKQHMRLLLAAALLCLASPALAGFHGTGGPWCWACAKYEYSHKCNAELNPRTHHCGCIKR
jgi:hypothetical protein